MEVKCVCVQAVTEQQKQQRKQRVEWWQKSLSAARCVHAMRSSFGPSTNNSDCTHNSMTMWPKWMECACLAFLFNFNMYLKITAKKGHRNLSAWNAQKEDGWRRPHSPSRSSQQPIEWTTLSIILGQSHAWFCINVRVDRGIYRSCSNARSLCWGFCLCVCVANHK